MKQKDYKEFLYEICGDCDCHNTNNRYCTLIEFITEANNSPRLLMQMKCVEKFKYEKHADMTWNDAFNLWTDEGYAVAFGELYNEEIKFRSLYKNVITTTDEDK